MALPFFENERRQIRKVVDYAKSYIYQLNDLLDMKLGDMDTPSEDAGHSVRVRLEKTMNYDPHIIEAYSNIWVCYYLVDHPNKGRCHYFHIQHDISRNPPNKPQMAYIVRKFGIESPLLDEHITIDNEQDVVNIILSLVLENDRHRLNLK